MNITLPEQCCTLRQALRLKELGVSQLAYFYFIHNEDGTPLTEKMKVPFHAYMESLAGEPGWAAAFTSAELGELLPLYFTSYKNPGLKGPMAWKCELKETYEVYGETEAQARASMLIGLLEKDNVRVSELAPEPYYRDDSKASQLLPYQLLFPQTPRPVEQETAPCAYCEAVRVVSKRSRGKVFCSPECMLSDEMRDDQIISE